MTFDPPIVMKVCILEKNSWGDSRLLLRYTLCIQTPTVPSLEEERRRKKGRLGDGLETQKQWFSCTNSLFRARCTVRGWQPDYAWRAVNDDAVASSLIKISETLWTFRLLHVLCRLCCLFASFAKDSESTCEKFWKVSLIACVKSRTDQSPLGQRRTSSFRWKASRRFDSGSNRRDGPLAHDSHIKRENQFRKVLPRTMWVNLLPAGMKNDGRKRKRLKGRSYESVHRFFPWLLFCFVRNVLFWRKVGFRKWRESKEMTSMQWVKNKTTRRFLRLCMLCFVFDRYSTVGEKVNPVVAATVCRVVGSICCSYLPRLAPALVLLADQRLRFSICAFFFFLNTFIHLPHQEGMRNFAKKWTFPLVVSEKSLTEVIHVCCDHINTFQIQKFEKPDKKTFVKELKMVGLSVLRCGLYSGNIFYSNR